MKISFKEQKFVFLNDNKQPMHKFKDTNMQKTYEELMTIGKDIKCVGMIVPNDCIVLDIDDKKQAKIMDEILEYKGIETLTAITTRGKHYYFQNVFNNKKNGSKILLPVGIVSDIRVSTSTGYLIIKQNGKFRNFNKKSIRPLPCFLRPLYNAKAYGNYNDNMIGMQESSGRNETIRKHLMTLKYIGFNYLETKETIELINNFIFSKSLEEKEFQHITRENLYKSLPTRHIPRKNLNSKTKTKVKSEELNYEYKMIQRFVNDWQYDWVKQGFAYELYKDEWCLRNKEKCLDKKIFLEYLKKFTVLKSKKITIGEKSLLLKAYIRKNI